MLKRLLTLLIFCLAHVSTYGINTSIIVDGTLTVTLDQPGTFLVAQNLNFSPVTTGTAIYITSSDVILDLMGYTLSQANGVANVCGIAVTAGLMNVTIRNGTISDFSWSAINVASGCSQIFLDNLLINDCGTRGIEFVGTTASPIFESFVTNCACLTTCTLSTADNVFTFSNVYDTMFSDCVTASCGSVLATSTLSMVKVVNGFRQKYKDITILNNTGNFDLRGFSFSNTQTSIFTNCVVNGMVASGGGSNCQGFVLESNSIGLTGSSIANIFNNCIANGLTGTNNVDGFFTGSGCVDNGFFGCTAQNLIVKNVSGVISGFRFVNNARSRVFNCYALTCSASANNTTASPLYAAHGFKFDTVSAATTRQCVANDIYGAPTGRSVGFFWIGSTASVVSQCSAERCFVGYDLFSAQTAGLAGNSAVQNYSHKPISSNYVNFNATSISGSNPPTTLNGGANTFIMMNYGIT